MAAASVGLLAGLVLPGATLSGQSASAAPSNGSSPPGIPTAGSPAIPVCGVADVDGVSSSGLATPAVFRATPVPAPRTLIRSNQVAATGFGDSDLYVETSPTTLGVYSAAGQELRSIQLPKRTTRGASLVTGNANPTIIVDPSGDIYFFMMQGYAYDLVKLGSSGAQQWDLPINGTPNGLFAWHSASGAWAAAVVVRQSGPGTSLLVLPSGARASGTVPVPGTGNGEYVNATANRGLVSTDGNYIHVLSASGSPIAPSTTSVPSFGSAGSGDSTAGQTPGAAFAFIGLGGAVEVGSTIYVADAGPSNYGHGIELFATDGIYEGAASTTALENLQPGSPLYYESGDQSLIFLNGNGVAAVSLSAVRDLVRDPAAPTQNGFGDTLGVGAGITTSATAGYFPSGTPPVVTASLDPWWRTFPDPLELRYWVASGTQVTTADLPAPTAVPLRGQRGFRRTVQLQIQNAPGTYLVNADLVDTRTKATIGSTCLTYSVGTPGASLDFSQLAPGIDYSGPAPERGVQLASVLGTGDMRQQLDMATLLPNCNASSPKAAQCGPGALQNWSAYDPATEQAAAEAKSLGVSFEVQIGQDDPVDEALVSGGYWQGDVQAIAEHFASSAPDLDAIEAWNEPNTGPFNPASYVDTVLEPVHAAVKAADAADGKTVQVIGGTVLGMDVSGWWTGIAKAGGFADMDIVGIHPYPGYNRSFEEEGTPAAITQLKGLMASYGASSLPIWITEQGWWSDGEEDFYDVGNWAPREWMWLRALGVTSWNYFITEGQFSGFGTDYSLIDASNGDYFVKPGAIGLMTVSSLLGSRPFIKQVDLGIPHAYGMLFGPPSNGSATDDVLAVWTDDLEVPGTVSVAPGSGRVTIPTISSLGAPASLTVSPGSPAPLLLSGAPTYLTVPAGSSVSVGPSPPFGPNLALASEGVTATASSSRSRENAASDVIRGTATAADGGALGTTPAWAPDAGDRSPWIAVHLKSPQTVNRVIVSTSTIGSVQPGLRGYSVQVDTAGGWTTVATVKDQFFDRMELFSFPSVAGASAVRIAVDSIDYGDLAGGAIPYYWNLQKGFFNVPTVYSVEVYGP